MNKDQVSGRVKQVEGKVKEITGTISGDKRLEKKGQIEKVIGKVQAGYGDAKAKARSDLKKDL